MVTEAVSTPIHRRANGFAGRLRLLPRRVRIAYLIGFRAVAGFFRHDGLSWAAAMAFWFVLSLPPLLIALSSLTTAVVGREAARALLAEQVASQLPASGSVITEILEQEISVFSLAGLGSVAFLLFAGSRVFAAIVTAISAMWHHVERDTLRRRILLRAVMLLAVGGLMATSILLQLGIAGAQEDLGALTGMLVHFVLPFLLVVGGLYMTYWLVPRGRATWRTALVGALITAALLRVAQLAFWFLLTGVVDFRTGYGSLAGIAVLMVWAVVASSIVLIGAEFVATLDRHRLTQVALPSSDRGQPEEQNG